MMEPSRVENAQAGPTRCPEEERLVLLAAGRLSDASLRLHVESCLSCRSAVDQIRRDTSFVDDFLAFGPAPASNGRSAGFAPDASAPESIAGYESIRELIRGGQGVVFRAVQANTRRAVAIKMLLSGRFATPRERYRFEREIEIAASLRHPNIVTVYESIELPDGRYGYAMEFIEGKTLDEWAGVRQSGGFAEAVMDARSRIDAWIPPARSTGASGVRIPPTTRRVLTMMIKVCRAVQFAHARGVIHRDLKPANILVDKDDEPHILDFGLARREGLSVQRGKSAEFSRQGVFEGTPAYASPEQVDGRRPDDVDARTDVYSLGVILYKSLTGEHPYPVDGSLRDVFNAICTGEPMSPSEAARRRSIRTISTDLETIILRSIEKDRERRYQSPRALADDLERLLRGEAIDARRDSVVYVMRKALWRYRRITAAAAFVVTAFSAASVVAWRSAADADAARKSEAAEIQRAREEAARSAGTSYVLSHILPPMTVTNGSPTFNAMTQLSARLQLGAMGIPSGAEPIVHTTLGAMYREQGLMAYGEMGLRHALVQLQREYGPGSLTIGPVLHELGTTLMMRGRFEQAEQVARRAVELQRRFGDGRTPEAARSLDLLALIRLKRGDLSDARANSDAAREIRRDLYGDASLQTADSYATDSRIHLASGSPAEAVEAAARALRIRFSLTGDEDSSLSDAVLLLSDAAEAVERARASGALGSSTPGLSPSSSELLERWRAGELRSLVAAVWPTPSGSGRGPAVSDLFDLLRLKKDLLGEHDQSFAQTLISIAMRQWEGAAWWEAADCYATAATHLERAFGPDSMAVANCLENQSTMLSMIGLDERAFEVGMRSVAIWRAQPFEIRDDFQAANNARYYAMRAIVAGMPERALPVVIDSLEEFAKSIDSTSPAYLRGLATYSLALSGLGEIDEAEVAVSVALSAALQDPVVPIDQVLEMHLVMGAVRFHQGRFDEAEWMLRMVWDLSVTSTPTTESSARFVSSMMRRIAYERCDPAAEAYWRVALDPIWDRSKREGATVRMSEEPPPRLVNPTGIVPIRDESWLYGTPRKAK